MRDAVGSREDVLEPQRAFGRNDFLVQKMEFLRRFLRKPAGRHFS